MSMPIVTRPPTRKSGRLSSSVGVAIHLSIHLPSSHTLCRSSHAMSIVAGWDDVMINGPSN